MERLLIKKVKENDVLYNAKSTYYRDTDVRQRTWEKIGKELNLRAEEARSAWDKLRRCFINARNRRRIKEHECGITIHPWKYEKDMAFLWPFVERNRRTLDYTRPDGTTMYDSETEDATRELSHENTTTADADNVKAEIDDLQEYNSPDASVSYYGNEEFPSPMVETMLGIKRKYPKDDDIPERMDYKKKCLFQENSLLEMDESDLFFMSMSKMTKSLPILERAKVKLAVSNVVLQALITVRENVTPS